MVSAILNRSGAKIWVRFVLGAAAAPARQSPPGKIDREETGRGLFSVEDLVNSVQYCQFFEGLFRHCHLAIYQVKRMLYHSW